MNYDVLISLLIVAGVMLAVIVSRRDATAQGRANPVGTANLQTDVSGLKTRMARMEADIKNIQNDLDHAPTKADIEVLRGLIMTLAERTSGIGGHVESVDQAVVRIEMKLDNLSPAPITRTRSRK